MKAWQIDRHGGLEVLKRVEIASPKPGPMEVLVRVEAVGLNHLDLWVRKGVPGHTFPLPITPGCDVAGTVAELGPGASGVDVGAPVVVNPGISCGRCEACLGGFDPLCRSYGILGETRDGGCADYVAVPLTNLIERPRTLSAVQAAALPIPFLTAWTMLTRKACVKPGETVLVQAGGSGVGVAAIQIAKLLGATVITTVGSADKVSKALALGADHVIPYKTTPFRDEVKRITGKKGCDIVIDHVGADTFGDSLKCLAWGGRYVTCGATTGAKVELNLQHVFFKNLSVLGSTMGSKADLIRVIELVAQGKLKAVIDSTFPVNELPKAQQRLESREAFGKVVLSGGD